MNLYGFVGNDGVNKWDLWGMVEIAGADDNLGPDEDFGNGQGFGGPALPPVIPPPVNPVPQFPPGVPGNLPENTHWYSVHYAIASYQVDLGCLACCSIPGNLLMNEECRDAVETFSRHGMFLQMPIESEIQEAVGGVWTIVTVEGAAFANAEEVAKALTPKCYVWIGNAPDRNRGGAAPMPDWPWQVNVGSTAYATYFSIQPPDPVPGGNPG